MCYHQVRSRHRYYSNSAANIKLGDTLLKFKILLMGSLLLISYILPVSAYAAVDGETVVSGKCTTCHGADRIRDTSKTEAEWEKLVDEEIERGALLNSAERKAAIKYLAANFGKADSSDEEEAVEVADSSTAEETSTEEDGSEDPLPFDEQAETGVELWYFFATGGALLGGGIFLRRQ